MVIAVGTKNEVKINAVRHAIALYPDIFPQAAIEAREVNIEEFGHPKNLEETISGAVQRAREAFTDCEYSIGIEGGLIEVPQTATGYMETGVCAIYDGRKIHLGLAPAFEWPKGVTEYILQNKGDASQAFKEFNLTHHEKLGAEEGGITGFLTKGRLNREDTTRTSIIMAMIQIERSDLY